MHWTTEHGTPVVSGWRTVGWLNDDGSWFQIGDTSGVEVVRIDGWNVWLSAR